MPAQLSAQTGSREAHRPSQPGLFPEGRAEPARAPEPTPGVLKALRERAAYQVEREGTERRSVLRGLLLLALLTLVVSLVYAGTDRAFFTGWWRQW